MNLSSLAIKRPVATIMLLLMIVVLGVAAMITIPLDLMPKMELPYAMIITNYSNASPEEVESMVTTTVESAVASVENLDKMASFSLDGSSMVMIQFKFDTDMNFATLEMREKIAMVEDYLPEECSKPLILKLDMNMFPISQVYISSESRDLAQLTSLVENDLLPRFERASGVASVSVTGGVSDEVSVEFSQEELSEYGLSIATLSQILAAENINLPSGTISKGDTDLIVRSIGKFKDITDIENLPITLPDRSIVRLGDISTISMDNKEQTSIARINRETAIGVMISKQSDANTVKTSDAVRRTVTALQKEFPDVDFIIGYDSADYIKNAIGSVAQSAVLGSVLAIVVVFIFLRNIRATLIIGISIPSSLLAAFAIMDWRDITLNMITLCALTICVGMLVDNSIVVLENIFRLKSLGNDSASAANQGASEVLLAIIASTLTTVMVFLPVALAGGLSSVLFRDFCWTIIIALLSSLLVAVTIIPMLFSQIFRRNINQTYLRIGERRYKYKLLNKFAAFIENLSEKYSVAVRKVLRHRKKFLVSGLLLFLVSMLLIFTVGLEILPESDEGMISLTAEMPYGTSLEDKDKIMSKVEEYLVTLPEVTTVALVTDSLTQMSTGNTNSVTIILTDRSQREKSAVQLAKEIEEHLSNIPEASISATSSSSFTGLFGDADLSLLIKGKSIDKLEEIGRDLANQIKTFPGVTDASLDVEDGSPELSVIIDRNTAAYYGVTSYQLANGLSSAISGKTATRLNVDGNQIDVRLSLTDNIAESVEAIKQIEIVGNYGMSVPVGQLATFEYGNAPTQIYRENQVNTVTLNVNMDSASLTSGPSEITDFVKAYPFPDGYYVGTDGTYEEMMDLFGSLLKALLIAVALVFLILAAQFESMLMAFVVMMAVPFAMTGAFLAMFITDTALSLTSFLGLIMLVGIVVNNSILLVEFIRQTQDTLGLEEALVRAGALRLRPILMSCVTTVVGMIPLSLGFGQGGEILAPMGISIIGGLTASTIVTLFIVPVFYSLIDDGKTKRRNKRDAKDKRISELEKIWEQEDGLSHDC